MEVIKINPFEGKTTNIAFQGDTGNSKIVFEGIEGNNNYLKLLTYKKELMQFPIPDNTFEIESYFTKKPIIYTAQIYKKINGELIANTPIFKLSISESISTNNGATETIPKPFQTAYDNMVDITKQIKNSYDKGDLNGDSAYELAVKNGFKGTEKEWLDSLKYDHSEEFQALADKVKQDAEKSLQSSKNANQSELNAKQSENNINDSIERFNTDYDSKVSSFNENVETKTNIFNDNAQLKNTEFDDKTLKANEVIDTKVKKATDEANRSQANAELSIKTAIKPITKGNPITINDSTDYKLHNVKVHGSTTQEVREGYNLLDFGQLKKFKKEGNIWVTNEEYLPTDKIVVDLPIGEYVLKYSVKSPVGCNFRLNIHYEDGSNEYEYKESDGTSFRDFTTSIEKKKIAYINVDYSSNNKLPVEIKEPMLVTKVNSEKPYEAYGKAPTPEFPSEIKNGVIKSISNVGKNLIKNMVYGAFGNTDGNIIQAKDYQRTDIMDINQDTILCLSSNPNLEKGSINVHCWHNDQWLGQKNGNYINDRFPSTNKIGLNFYTKEIEKLNDVQLELGSEATSYEPYKGETYTLSKPIELSKWDSIEIRDGVVGKVNGTYKNTYTGSTEEDWKLYNFESGKGAFVICEKPKYKYRETSKGAFSSNYISGSDINYDKKDNQFYMGIDTINILDNMNCQTLDSLKSYLSKAHLTVIFQLENETFEPLPPQDQEIFKKLVTFYPNTTFITDEGIELEIQYYADTEKWVIKKIDEKLKPLQNAVIESI